MPQPLQDLINRYPELDSCAEQILAAFHRMKQSYENGGKLLVAGNGGSAADSGHIVGELMKGFMQKRPLPQQVRERLIQEIPGDGVDIAEKLQGALPAISLDSHSALITAFANDVAAELIFAQQVYGYGRSGDVFLGLSTSGSSVNVVRAVQVAKAMGLATIGMTGEGGGRLAELCDTAICVPYTRTPDIQERHLPIYHTLCIMLEEVFFP